jgi:predicted nucleic acid-binding protein
MVEEKIQQVMKYFFLDTNILFDFLLDRKPYSQSAALLLSLAEKRKVGLFVSIISFNNLYYVLRKVSSHSKTINALKGLETYLRIIDFEKDILQLAMNSEFNDLEDAIQYFSASRIEKIDAIVTRNSKDFRHSQIPVLLPDAAVKLV